MKKCFLKEAEGVCKKAQGIARQKEIGGGMRSRDAGTKKRQGGQKILKRHIVIILNLNLDSSTHNEPLQDTVAYLGSYYGGQFFLWPLMLTHSCIVFL